MQRLIPVFLVGCLFVGKDAHQTRIDALTDESDTDTDADADADADTDTDTDADADADTDTDSDTDTDTGPSAPVLTELGWRFRFSGFNIYEGIQLTVQATDADGDLAALVIEGGEEVAWTEAIPRADDWYLVPIALDLGDPCAVNHDATIDVHLRDAAGNVSPTQTLNLQYTGFLHDESNITSGDQCEPCVGGLTTMDLPIVACGDKHSQGYIDYYDAVEITAEGSWGNMLATVNYGQDAAGLRFSLIYPPALDFVEVREGSNTIGYAIDTTVPAAPTVHEFAVDATDFFFSGSWKMFIERAPPPAAPAP